MMKKDKLHIKHRFDPWHLAKSVRKDFVAASRRKSMQTLYPGFPVRKSPMVECSNVQWGPSPLPGEVEIYSH